MKKWLLRSVIVLLLGLVWFMTWSTETRNVIYSTVINNTFYAPIAEGELDFTKQGAKVRFPLEYTFDSVYMLSIRVTNFSFSSDDVSPYQTGKCKVTFFVRGQPVFERTTEELIHGVGFVGGQVSDVNIFKFGLPLLSVYGDDLEMEIEVIAPYDALKPFNVQGYVIESEYHS